MVSPDVSITKKMKINAARRRWNSMISMDCFNTYWELVDYTCKQNEMREREREAERDRADVSYNYV